MLVAGVLTIVGAVAGLLLPIGLADLVTRVLYPLLGEFPPAWVGQLAFAAVWGIAFGVPALQLAGAVRLLSGRGRRLLLLTGPLSLFGVGRVVQALAERPDDAGWRVLLVLSALPVLGALLAALPPTRPAARAAAASMPGAAGVAAVLGLLGCAFPLFQAVLALVDRLVVGDRTGSGQPVALLVLEVGLLVATFVGALLLLGRRSWLGLAVPAAAYCLVAGTANSSSSSVILAAPLPAGAAVLAVLPSVRRWIGTRSDSPGEGEARA
ncbi:hypothetical protein DQ237_14195 [Blastococcus sp. TF02-8]|nr:hypothetical protein DQ237_14195 [Blastococcus sp. TF02-8]